MKQDPTPIWHNFSGVFLYDFHWPPMMLAIIMSMLLFILGSGAFGWAAAIILNAMLFKYAFVALQQTAKGNMTPPSLHGRIYGVFRKKQPIVVMCSFGTE